MSNAAVQMIDQVAMDAFLDTGQADDAVFEPARNGVPVACRVMVDRDLQMYGIDSRMATPTIAVRALVAEVGRPVRGDAFVVGSERFVVDAPLEVDESMVTLVVAKGAV